MISPISCKIIKSGFSCCIWDIKFDLSFSEKVSAPKCTSDICIIFFSMVTSLFLIGYLILILLLYNNITYFKIKHLILSENPIKVSYNYNSINWTYNRLENMRRSDKEMKDVKLIERILNEATICRICPL